MLTRARLQLPTTTGDVAKDLENFKRVISDYFLLLESKGILQIDEAQIRAAQGIKFPASQGAVSSDANTLDDYAEANWTPTDASGAALTFAAAEGHYVRIGKTVWAWGYVVYPATANANAAKIGSLPFTVANTEASRGGGMVTYATEATLDFIIAAKNTTNAALATAGGATVSNATMSGDTVYFLVIYPV